MGQRPCTWILCTCALAFTLNATMAASGQSGPVSPSQVTTPVISGQTLFQEKGCAYCHGAAAEGTKKAPSLETIGSHWKKTAIARQIREGGAGMPAFGTVLSEAEVTELVSYLAGMRKEKR